MRLGTLLDDSDKTGPAITRATERLPTASFSTGEESTREHMHFFALAHNKAGRHMEPFLIQIAPNQTQALKKSSHEGEEFIYVLDGELNVAYGANQFSLKKGDSIYLDSIVAHLVTAQNSPATILAVVYIPV
jgi:quercetin dioxygenase-like cupin family protein